MTDEAQATLGLSDAPEPIETEVAEVTTEVDAESKSDELAESSTAGEEVKSEEVSEEKPKVDPVQKRIDELTKKRRAAERDSEYWREQALKKQSEEPVKPVDESLKTLEDFDYDEDKYKEHLIETARKDAIKEARRIVAEEQSQVEQARKQAEFRGRELAFSKTIDDYSEVVTNPALSISQAMADVATQMENGPEVLYYLGKHPDISEELANLPPLLAARELGRIEAKIHLQKQEAKKVSNAPKPPPKISVDNPSTKKNIDDMTQKEFNAARRKYIATHR